MNKKEIVIQHGTSDDYFKMKMSNTGAVFSSESAFNANLRIQKDSLVLYGGSNSRIMQTENGISMDTKMVNINGSTYVKVNGNVINIG